MLPDTPTQGSTTPTQHLLRTRENLNEIHDYSTTAHSHTEATDDVRTSNLALPFFLNRTNAPSRKINGYKCSILFSSEDPYFSQLEQSCIHIGHTGHSILALIVLLSHELYKQISSI